MFWKLVFCKLQNIRWQINITAETSNRDPWSKWLNPPNSYGTHLIKSYKNGTPLIKNSTSQKWHPTSIAFHNYIIGFLKYHQFNTLLIESTPAIGHKIVIRIPLCSGKKLTLKLNDHESVSHNKFKNFLLKITQLSPWQIAITSGHFFAGCAIFLRKHFLWVSYLSIAGREFVICHFCKVPLF